MDFDNLKYLTNMNRGGLYQLDHCNRATDNYGQDIFTFHCVYGRGLTGSNYVDQIVCNKRHILALIEDKLYIPLYSEKEALAYKLKL